MTKIFEYKLMSFGFVLSLGWLLAVPAKSQLLTEGIGSRLASPIPMSPDMANWENYNFLKSYYPVFPPPNFTPAHWETIKDFADRGGVASGEINGANCVWLKRDMPCYTTVPKCATEFPKFLPASAEDGFPYKDYNRMLTVYQRPNRANVDCWTYFEHRRWKIETSSGVNPESSWGVQAGIRVTPMSSFINLLPRKGQTVFDPGIRYAGQLLPRELSRTGGEFVPSIMFTDRTIAAACPTAGCISSALLKARMRAYVATSGNVAGSFVRSNILSSPEAAGTIAASAVSSLGAPDWAAEGVGIAGAGGALGYQAYLLSGGSATGLSFGPWMMTAGKTIATSGAVSAAGGAAIIAGVSAPAVYYANDLNTNVTAVLSDHNQYIRSGGSQAELDVMGLNLASSNYWSAFASYHYGWISTLSPF